jgi:hypothetical protein
MHRHRPHQACKAAQPSATTTESLLRSSLRRRETAMSSEARGASASVDGHRVSIKVSVGREQPP